jgi:hypothetical protein
MDPVTSAVMVLLWCSPDMLFCRRPPTETPEPIFLTVSSCEKDLKDRLASAKASGTVAVGRCQPIGSVSRALNWGISPNRELLISVEPEKPPADAVPVDAALTVPAPSVVAGADPEYTTVRVTYGTGNDAVTNSYVVKRSN